MVAFLNMSHTTGDIMIALAMSVTPHAVSRLQWALSSRGRLDFAKCKLCQGPSSACWAYLHQHEHVQTRKVWAHVAWHLKLAYALAHVMGATFEAFTRSVDEYRVKSWVHSLAIQFAFYGTMMCNMYSLGIVDNCMTEKAEAAWTRGLGLVQSNFARTGWEQDSWAKTTLRAKEFLSRKRFFKSPVRLSWLHFTQAKNQQASSIIKVFRLLPGQRANGQTHPRIHFLIWKLSECLQPLAIHEFHEFLWLSISKMSKKTCDHQESSSKHFEHHAVCQQFFC